VTTLASWRMTNSTCCRGMPHTVLSATAGDTYSGTPEMVRLVGVAVAEGFEPYSATCSGSQNSSYQQECVTADHWS
jgi:hypothetical protein